jgi:uncharacterized membrane protein
MCSTVGLLLVAAAGGSVSHLALDKLGRLEVWIVARPARIRFLLAGLILGYCVLWCAVTFLRHYYFHSSYDLGIMNQVAWNTSQGRLFARSIEVSSDLGDHVRPYLAVLGIAYIVLPSAYLLLGFQSLVLALSAVPLYVLARRHLNSSTLGLLVAFCFLAYPPLGFVNRYDFHVEVISIPLLIAAFERIDAGDVKRASLFMALTLFCKENLGLTVAALGITAGLCYKARRFGAIWAVTGVAYSAVALLVVIPAFRGEPSDTLSRYHWMADTPSQMLWALLSQPWLVLQRIFAVEHILTLLQLLAPFAFLPLAGWFGLLPAAPTLTYNFLAEWTTQATIYSHYMAPAIPFMPIATVLGLRRLAGDSWSTVFKGLPATDHVRSRRPVALGAIVMVVATLASWIYQNPVTGKGSVSLGQAAQTVPNGAKTAVPLVWPNDAAIREGLKQVRDDARVLTTSYYAPHLSKRVWIEMIPKAPVANLVPEADAIFLNLRDSRWWTCEDYFASLRAAAQANFGVVFNRDFVLLVEKGRGEQTELKNLVRAWRGCG